MTPRSRRLLAALLLTAAPIGCGIPASTDAFDATPEARFLRTTIDKLAARDFDTIESLIDARIGNAAPRADLERAADELPSGAIVGVQPVDWHVNFSASGPRTAVVAAEYAYPGSKWVLASATLIGEPEDLRIVGLHVQRLPAPLATIYSFGLRGKSQLHFAFLLLAVASAALSLFAFVRCLWARDLRLKWLWAPLILVGVCRFSIQWASGEVSTSLLTLGVPSAMLQRNGVVGPWILSFGLPVAAVVFLSRRRAITSKAPGPQDAEPPRFERPRLELPRPELPKTEEDES